MLPLIEKAKKDVHSLTIKELEKLIPYLSKKYYNQTPLVEDEFFDTLVDELKRKNRDSKILKNIGAPVREDVVKVKLPIWLGSLDKVKPDSRDLSLWLERYQDKISISDKLDGISALIQYTKNNILMYTRGDGFVGQDISYLIPHLSLPILDKEIFIRGELIMKKSIFESKYAKIYPKARSVVAGIVNSKKPDLNILQDIDFVAYELFDPKINFIASEQFKIMKHLSFKTVYNELVSETNQELLTEKLKERKNKGIYEVDGLVLISNIIYKRNQDGNPKYAVAFKINEAGIATTVIEVIWKASKHGILIPRLKFESIILDGDKVQYCTAFHANFIEKYDVGPGSKIRVVKSGDVIPYVTKIISGTSASFPNLKYHWNENHVDIILDEDNENVVIMQLINFFKIMNIIGVSEGTVKKLVQTGFDNIKLIYQATAKNFLQLPHFQDKSAQKLYDNIHSVLDKNISLAKLMTASLIFGNGFGEKRFSIIIDAYPKILRKEKITISEVEDLEGFSNIMATKFIENYDNFWLWLEKYPFLKYEKETIKVITKSGEYKDQYVVFSGFRSTELEEEIKSQGGVVQNTVNSKTTLVLTKDINKSSSKLKKAKDLNISIKEYLN